MPIAIIFYLLCNLLLISVLRAFKYKREIAVFYSQLLFVILSNIFVFINYKNVWTTLEIFTFTIMTFWTSILVLEIWAMTNDGYTIALYLLIYNDKLSKTNMRSVDNLIQNKKKKERLDSLVKLKLLKLSSTGNQVTPLGLAVLKMLAFVKIIFVLKSN